MATNIYTGGAANVANVSTLTPGGTIVADTTIFTINLGSATLEVTATDTTVAQSCNDILEALTAANVPPEFNAFTWEVDDTATPTLVRGTGPDDGYPGYAFLSSSADGSATLVTATVTTPTGSKHWDNIDNWSTGGIPSTGDVVYLGMYGIVPQYAIGALSGVTLSELHIVSNDVGGLLIGLPVQNPVGYVEYLPTMLTIGATTIVYGEENGNSIPGLRLNTGSVVGNMQVLRSDTRDTNGRAPIYWQGSSSAGNTITDCRGAVDIATYPGAPGQFATIVCSGGGSVEVGVLVVGPSAGNITSITMNGGDLVLRNAGGITTVTMRSGATALVTGNAGVITNLTQEAGSSIDWRRQATVTNYVSSGSIDFSQDSRGSKTFTNVDIFAGAVWNDPNQVVTTTNGIDLNRCGNEDVTVIVGKHRRLTPGTVA